MEKPAHLPFHLLAWGQLFVKGHNCQENIRPKSGPILPVSPVNSVRVSGKVGYIVYFIIFVFLDFRGLAGYCSLCSVGALFLFNLERCVRKLALIYLSSSITSYNNSSLV